MSVHIRRKKAASRSRAPEGGALLGLPARVLHRQEDLPAARTPRPVDDLHVAAEGLRQPASAPPKDLTVGCPSAALPEASPSASRRQAARSYGLQDDRSKAPARLRLERGPGRPGRRTRAGSKQQGRRHRVRLVSTPTKASSGRHPWRPDRPAGCRAEEYSSVSALEVRVAAGSATVARSTTGRQASHRSPSRTTSRIDIDSALQGVGEDELGSEVGVGFGGPIGERMPWPRSTPSRPRGSSRRAGQSRRTCSRREGIHEMR